MIPFDKKEALPEVQQRIVPQKANEHFALKVTKQQKNLSYTDCRQSPRNWMQSTVFSFIIRIENEYKGARRHDVQTFNGRSYAIHCH